MIEIYEHKNTWFKPVFLCDSWQVAILHYDDKQRLDALEKLDIHLDTDEVFILSKGCVALIAADTHKNPYEYHVEVMEPGSVYNVPKNVWHNIAMKPSSSVYIIENKNTHLKDFEFRYLNIVEKKQMHDAVDKLWNMSI